jgi:hypothetical protein
MLSHLDFADLGTLWPRWAQAQPDMAEQARAWEEERPVTETPPRPPRRSWRAHHWRAVHAAYTKAHPGGRTADACYDAEETAVLRAVEIYARLNRRPFPTTLELLRILHALGYRGPVAASGPLAGSETPTSGLTTDHTDAHGFRVPLIRAHPCDPWCGASGPLAGSDSDWQAIYRGFRADHPVGEISLKGYTAEELAVRTAIRSYQRAVGAAWPRMIELFWVLRALGYRRVTSDE